MTIEYEALTPDEFNAVVTGELTHYAISFEDRLNDFLVLYLGILLPMVYLLANRKIADVPTLEVEVVGRSGKEKLFLITPQTHREQLERLEHELRVQGIAGP